MAKTKFTINKKTLVEERGDGYILTRVPNSNMDYYMLLRDDEILSEDNNTIMAEWDAGQELNVLPRILENNETRRPTLKEAVEARDNSAGITMKAGDLYKEYYEYDENLDPQEREKLQRIREQRRQEALSRSDISKKMRQNAQEDRQPKQAANKEKSQPQKKNVEAKPMTPAERMAQQRAQIQHYSKQQFKEILKGTRQRLDTSLYRNINLQQKQMKELRLSLKAGLDVTRFNSPYISAKHMKEIRLGAKRGVKLDMEKLDHSQYNAEQMHELRLGFEKKVNVNKYVDPSYEAAQMREIRLALQAGLDTTKMEDIHLSIDQMHAVRVRMVMDNLEDILKRMFEDIRSWLSEKIEDVTEHLRARYQGREPMTPEQIKDVRIDEAVEDIKETLIQSELISEEAYSDKGIDAKIKDSIREWQDYMEQEPEQNVEQAAKEAAKDVCQTAGVEMDQPKEEKVVNIHESVKSISQAVEEAVDEAMQQAYEMDQETDQGFEIEEESFEMMQ